MSEATRFRPSACRAYIVAQIGDAAPHVMTLYQARAVAEAYQEAAQRATDPVVVAYETASANAILMAVREASGK